MTGNAKYFCKGLIYYLNVLIGHFGPPPPLFEFKLFQKSKSLRKGVDYV